MPIDTRQHISGYLRFIRTCSLDVLKNFPEDKYCFQTGPEDNHPLWVLGHIALTDAWIASTVGIQGIQVPETWNAVCGQGSKPASDPKLYPSLADARKTFDSTRAAILNWTEGASEAQLSAPLKEKTGGFAVDVADALYKLGWHEGWHFGQVATLRRALKLPPVFGA
jgi:hypothetical protein